MCSINCWWSMWFGLNFWPSLLQRLLLSALCPGWWKSIWRMPIPPRDVRAQPPSSTLVCAVSLTCLSMLTRAQLIQKSSNLPSNPVSTFKTIKTTLLHSRDWSTTTVGYFLFMCEMYLLVLWWSYLSLFWCAIFKPPFVDCVKWRLLYFKVFFLFSEGINRSRDLKSK